MQNTLFEDISLTRDTPLRYAGGKTQARQDLYRFFHKLGATKIVSPFCGGCSFELYAASKGMDLYASDNFDILIRFWKILSEHSDKLSSKIESILDDMGFIITKDIDIIAEMLPDCEENIRNAAQNSLDAECDIESAAWLYIRNRTAYQAIMFEPKRMRCLQMIELKLGNKLSYKRLEDIRNFRTNVNFQCLDFAEAINKHSGEYIYLDPPYYSVDMADTYGMGEPFNHDKLRDSLDKQPNFILSYNDVEKIRELYEGFEFLEAKWHHPSRKKQSTRGNEVFIMPKEIRERLLK